MKLSNPARVGIIVIVALIAFSIIITWKSDIFLSARGYQLIGTFENVEGLTVGSEVRYRGFKIGKVIRIDPSPYDIKVYSIVQKDIQIPADSYLRVAFDGLVGLKFLEVRPGISADIYKSGQMLFGKRTSSIVDFVDIGAQNLVETKKILETILAALDKSKFEDSFKKVVDDIKQISSQLTKITDGLANIVANKDFQTDVKGTLDQTHKTLVSANHFFDSVSNLSIRPSGDIYVGNLANQVRANLDITQGGGNYVRFAIGEGPIQALTLQDIQIARRINPAWAMRLGMINTRLGGGVDYMATKKLTLSGDIYDINNRPGLPRLRLTSAYMINEYLDLALQADNVLNGASSNYSIGVIIGGRSY